MYTDLTLEQTVTNLLFENGCTVNRKAIRKLCDLIVDREISLIESSHKDLARKQDVVERDRPSRGDNE